MRREGRGFTLIEVLVALAIGALLAAGAATAIGSLGPRLRLRSGTWLVTSALNHARVQAVLTGETRRVRFDGPGLLHERFDGASGAWVVTQAVVLPGVAVRANNAPVFHPQGTVSDLATISVSNAAGNYRITVAITGRIRTVRTG